jgi:hypothetical protein
MNQPQPPLPNFSRDMQGASLAAAASTGFVTLATLVVTAALAFQTESYRTDGSLAAHETSEALQRLAEFRAKTDASELEASTITALQQRIAALRSLDVGSAPSVIRMLEAVEEIMPEPVALASLNYDRASAALELVAGSESSESLTAFFDAANRTALFNEVRVVDKKQAGNGESAASLFEIRLSIRVANWKP